MTEPTVMIIADNEDGFVEAKDGDGIALNFVVGAYAPVRRQVPPTIIARGKTAGVIEIKGAKE